MMVHDSYYTVPALDGVVTVSHLDSALTHADCVIVNYMSQDDLMRFESVLATGARPLVFDISLPPALPMRAWQANGVEVRRLF